MEHLSVPSNEEVWNVQGKADNKCSRNRLLCLFHEMRKNILLMSVILMAEPPVSCDHCAHGSSCYHTEAESAFCPPTLMSG